MDGKMEKKEDYKEIKEGTVDLLSVVLKNSKGDPFFEGSSRLFDYELAYSHPPVTDLELFLYFVATAVFQIENDGLEERVREQVTYWIYQYKKGVFKNLIENEELLKKDIQKIESMITLRFEDLECYEADK